MAIKGDDFLEVNHDSQASGEQGSVVMKSTQNQGEGTEGILVMSVQVNVWIYVARLKMIQTIH